MIVVDSHLHFYPCYELARAFSFLQQNLRKQAGGEQKVVLLAERRDCHFFREWRESGLRVGGFRVEAGAEADSVWLGDGAADSTILVAGRQVVTRERLEVLALTVDLEGQDDKPVQEVVRAVLDSGGIPVLAWSPGKWFFERGTLVRNLVESYPPGQILLGDSSLRPWFWGKPAVMQWAEQKGYSVLAGSDPLPFPGEEAWMGCYASRLEGDLSVRTPVESLRALLRNPANRPTFVGQRTGLYSFFHRQLALRMAGQ